jgi:hypothetical protein
MIVHLVIGGFILGSLALGLAELARRVGLIRYSIRRLRHR